MRRAPACSISAPAPGTIELLEIFGVPRALLPEVRDNAAEFGATEPELFGTPIPIRGMAGDQQAATIGQACFEPGMLKSTYGTGCFAVLNTGSEAIASKHRLLTTIAYQLDGKRTYALEGSIFVAGAAVQWLRDGLKVIARASDAGRMARDADAEQDVVLVPAFVGLGAPYWDPDCRGALFGLTRNTGPNELARAALQSVCFQTFDLLQAMRGDWPAAREDRPARRRRHGGLRLDHAAARRHPRRARRPADRLGDDGARRGLSRRTAVRASIRPPTSSPPAGRSISASRPAWPPPSAHASSPPGTTPSRRTLTKR